jgi:hypothetical protein
MALSPLQKSFLASAGISSILFGIATAPIAFFGSHPIEVQVRNQPVLDTEISDLAGPYLGIAGAVSAALGLSILGVGGWRSAANQSETERTKRFDLEQSLLTREAELERIKFSDARLKAENFDKFMQPEGDSALQHQSTLPEFVPASTPYGVPQSASSTVRQGYDRRGMYAVEATPGATAPYLYTANAKTAEHLGASTVSKGGSYAATRDHHDGADTQIEAVMDQLRDLMTRVESLQTDSEKIVA